MLFIKEKERIEKTYLIMVLDVQKTQLVRSLRYTICCWIVYFMARLGHILSLKGSSFGTFLLLLYQNKG